MVPTVVEPIGPGTSGGCAGPEGGAGGSGGTGGAGDGVHPGTSTPTPTHDAGHILDTSASSATGTVNGMGHPTAPENPLTVDICALQKFSAP
eukprot:1595445-Prymnesium_polylepis.1